MNRRGIGVVGAGAFLVLTVAAGWAAGLYSRLPFDDEIHTLLEIEERPVKEIAQLTGWSVALVKVRAFRARAEMRKCLASMARHKYL